MSKTKNEFGVTSMYITESNRCLTDAELGGVKWWLGQLCQRPAGISSSDGTGWCDQIRLRSAPETELEEVHTAPRDPWTRCTLHH